MSLTEFNEEEFIANRRAEGRAEGRIEEREEIVVRMIRKGKSDEEIVDITECPMEDVIRLRKSQMMMV